MKTMGRKIGTYSQDDKKRMKKMGREIRASEMVKLSYYYI
jgi:hypothetical protein